MNLAIICAMDEELAAIQARLGLTAELVKLEVAGNCYASYNYGQHTLITAVCGIGKVNAAITTQVLLDRFKIDAVLNVGVAGSLSLDLGFGDIVVASDLVQHDVDVSAFGLPRGQVARLNTYSFKADEQLTSLLQQLSVADQQLVYGRIVSGDQFIDDGEYAAQLHQQFNALACEMEGAAIAQVCYLNQVPFAVVRSLSDMAGQLGAASHSFAELKFMAAERAAWVTQQLLERLEHV